LVRHGISPLIWEESREQRKEKSTSGKCRFRH
jgi:hypothetical protein